MTPQEHQWLRDIHFTLTGIPNPSGEGRVPHHVAMAAVDKQLDVLASEAGVSDVELAEIKQAAMEGAASAFDAQAIAAAIPDELGEQGVDILTARLAG